MELTNFITVAIILPKVRSFFLLSRFLHNIEVFKKAKYALFW